MSKNWEALKYIKSGTALYHEWITEKIRFIIIRGPGALCAYFGIPSDHPAAGLDYTDLPGEIEVHGGFTFGDVGDEKWGFIEGWYWYGWDYAHTGDYCFFTDRLPERLRSLKNFPEHKWTVYDVIEDSRPAFKPFIQWIEDVEEDVRRAREKLNEKR